MLSVAKLAKHVLEPAPYHSGAAVAAAHGLAAGAESLPADAVEAGMLKVDSKHWQAMGIKEQAILMQANTLVVANTFGFRGRGFFKPGAERQQIRLVCHCGEEPIYAALLWRRLAALDARRMLPERLRRAVQYRLT